MDQEEQNDEVLFECLNCAHAYTQEEIGADENIVGTCPNCGGHRFKGLGP